MASATGLSSHDSSVLLRLFDPELTPNQPLAAATSPSPAISTILSPSGNEVLPYEPTLEPSLLKSLEEVEKTAIRLSEQALATPSPLEKLYEAKKLLDGLVHSHPTYASARNNRAQLSRLILTELAKSNTPLDSRRSIILELKLDLDTAITSLTPPSTSTAQPSEKALKILSNAHTQRGTLYFLASESPADYWEEMSEEQWNAEKEKLADLAHKDFTMGSKLGNELAKEMSVRTNPYAKLCGSMLKGVMKAEIDAYYGK
ncbi:hypothetical protein BJ508DRAFT_418455 [Ascobolus immersus RN42]|uniref:Uncharacterized protein n=1 Tax=Ascobolus immersus RN42 TaxID=1160509 RepID=A0A3N4HSM3_ASCIM|nr:hypothetical protein BJ508DRAFT_418455 [Ascobolus immersus RN42]